MKRLYSRQGQEAVRLATHYPRRNLDESDEGGMGLLCGWHADWRRSSANQHANRTADPSHPHHFHPNSSWVIALPGAQPLAPDVNTAASFHPLLTPPHGPAMAWGEKGERTHPQAPARSGANRRVSLGA